MLVGGVAYSSSDLAAIEAAIARGERVVQFGDRSVTYRSIDELLQAKADILRDLSSAGTRPRQYVIAGSKGLC
jgi:hypothetical protein